MQLAVFAALVGWGAPAYAQEAFVRAASGVDAFVVVVNNGGKDAQVWLSRQSNQAVSVSIPLNTWVLDAAIDNQGTLWLAIGNGGKEDGPVRIWRYGVAGTSSFSVPGSMASTEAHLFAGADDVSLATPDGLWLLSESSAGSKDISWGSETFGFYAASFLRTSRGWQAMVPTFNTCGSSDLLEEVAYWEISAQGQARRRWLGSPPTFTAPWYGADGRIYAGGSKVVQNSCILRRRDSAGRWPILFRVYEKQDDCIVEGYHNDRFTLVRLSNKVVRVHRGGVAPLGSWKQEREVWGIYPDHRGRALVLFRDGSLIRYAQHTRQQTVAVFPLKSH